MLKFYSIDNFINDNLNKGAGNSIIILDLLYKHLMNINSFNGRIISLRFMFAKNTTLDVIGVYLPPLKDLNIDWNKDLARYTQAKNLLNLIKERNLKDCHKTLLSSTENTFFSSTSSTRIDYIYGNTTVINHTANLTNEDTNNFYNSDHYIISCYITTQNLFNLQLLQDIAWSKYAEIRIKVDNKRHLNETYITKKPECWNNYTQLLETNLNQKKHISSTPITANLRDRWMQD
ncbi:hypothetical protein RCL_jg25183.t1 [Rhizophagus clarus]|uniref:Endonuclease/exonuclease/phosphatase domain-containing protein n=1 Tax=Rhizophagus clarus TaxID=94130 RepID=A0A8H3QVX1_9GLOM|nr:hypothetical protein RCL_jg25183.t1 [Rhizophagus clarus]